MLISKTLSYFLRSGNLVPNRGEPVRYDPNFKGPIQERSCTDILFLLAFLVFIGCWLAVGIFAFVEGDPNIVLVPKDSRGVRCGYDGPVLDKPYLFFFNLLQCLNSNPLFGCQTPYVCVKKCPEKMFIVDKLDEYGTVDDVICMPDVKRPTNQQEAMNLVKQGLCARWYLPSLEVQLRCVPNIWKNFDLDELKKLDENITFENLEKAKQIVQLLTRIEQVGTNIFDDVVKSWWKIFLGLIFAVVVCIVYIFLTRLVAGLMVWISIYGAVAALAFGVYFCARKYMQFKNKPESDSYRDLGSPLDKYMAMEETWLALLIISVILFIIILLVLLFLRHKIELAIALIKEASRAVSSITASLFFPVFPWCLQIIVILYAISVGLYLSTVGNPLYIVKHLSKDTCKCKGPAISYTNGESCDPTIFWNNCVNVKDGNPCTDATCSYDGTDTPIGIAYLHAINVFGFFWLLLFVSAMGEMILAGTFAGWYWTFKKSNVAFFIVTEAAIMTLRYHIGTLAFGSLTIAICRLMRIFLENIDSTLKKYEYPIVERCCKCFLWCLERFLIYINRNAYIMCAVHGTNFCTSAKDAFNLLMRNIVGVFVLNKVTDFLLFLSTVLVTALVTTAAYMVFITDYVDLGDFVDLGDEVELNYNYVPIIIIGVGTFFIASVFFSVFEMAVDTLFLCFLEDSERNDGSSEKPYYMSRNLRSILGKSN